MGKALKEDFQRLFKSKFFWTALVLMAIIAVISPVAIHTENLHYGEHEGLDMKFFMYVIYFYLISAVFIPLFIGKEYKDGVIQNQISTGMKRSQVYLGYYIVCAVAGVLMCTVHCVINMILGSILLGFFAESFGLVLLQILMIYLFVFAATALYFFVAILWKHHIWPVVLCVILALGMMFIGIRVSSRLVEPEYLTLEQGATTRENKTPNDQYLSGPMREVYKAVNDGLPGAQALQLQYLHEGNYPVFIGCDLVLVVVLSAIGIVIFNKKEI